MNAREKLELKMSERTAGEPTTKVESNNKEGFVKADTKKLGS